MIFFGTPEFSRVVLDALLTAHQIKPDLIVTSPDQPRGRGLKITPAPSASWAKEHGVPLFQPTKLDTAALEFIQKFEPTVGILAAYGKIIPQAVIGAFPKGIINIHPSLLPYYRGATPIESAILAGDLKTGVSLMLLVQKLDAGPVLYQSPADILPSDNSQTLAKRLAVAASHDLAKILPQWINDRIKAVDQDETKATYTKTFANTDYELEINKTAAELERQVRAFGPKPGAYLNVTYKAQPRRLKILEAQVGGPLAGATVGQFVITDNLPALATKGGLLILKTLQPPGKKPMPGAAFLNGYAVKDLAVV